MSTVNRDQCLSLELSEKSTVDDSSQNVVEQNRPAPGANHVFADNIRFLSMAAVIGLHTCQGYYLALHSSSIIEPVSYVYQALKFGTIGFFLVSGFLMGERLSQYSPVAYFQRRLRNVFVPWCVWFFLWFCLRCGSDLIRGKVADFNLSYLSSCFVACLFGTAFWFVPNLFLALAIILVFRRYLHQMWFGLILLLASLFYSANIYGQWILDGHTRAIFGFVFYLWLGVWSAAHYSAIERCLKRVHMRVLTGLTLLAYAIALGESRLIWRMNSPDPFNTLRLSNQIYSVLIVLVIMKLKGTVWPQFVNVREHTFGLYLTHTLALSLLLTPLKPLVRHIGAEPGWMVLLISLFLVPILFALVYGASLLVVRSLLKRLRLRWTVGLPLRKKAMVSHEDIKGTNRHRINCTAPSN